MMGVIVLDKNTQYGIRDALRALHQLPELMFREEGEKALDYLHAVIPAQHPARETLLMVGDTHRRNLRFDPDPENSPVLKELIETLRSRLEANPVDIPTFTTAQQLAEFRSYWHESEISVTLVGDHAQLAGSSKIDNAFPAGHAEMTLVFYDDNGQPVGQTRLADVLTFATDPKGWSE